MKLEVLCVPNTSATASGHNPSQQSAGIYSNILNTELSNYSRSLCMINLSFFLGKTFFSILSFKGIFSGGGGQDFP